MTKPKTLVKICGITTEQQAVQIAQLGADAIGIISVEESPRYIRARSKRKIFKTLENLYPKIERVSVYKNCPIDLIIKNFFGKTFFMFCYCFNTYLYWESKPISRANIH